MKTRAFHWVAAVWLAGSGLFVAGCQQPGEPDAVEVSKDAEGDTRIKIDGDKVDENLKKTEEQVQAGAQEVKEGAQQVGQAIERGAERVEAEVGPVVRDVLDDANLTAKIKAKLMADPEVNAFHIDVDTVDGQVTLTGRVATELQRTEAEQLASRTEGVSVVNNLIQVAGRQAVPPPPPAAGTGR